MSEWVITAATDDADAMAVVAGAILDRLPRGLIAMPADGQWIGWHTVGSAVWIGRLSAPSAEAAITAATQKLTSGILGNQGWGATKVALPG